MGRKNQLISVEPQRKVGVIPREVPFQKTEELRKLGRSVFQRIREIWYNQIMIRDVTDLEVYREALSLLKKLYVLLKKVPKSEYDTVRQCKKAGKSISANIAEGFAKRSSAAEFKRFLKIAIGSSDEIITHLRTLAIAVPRLLSEAKDLAGEYKILSKRLNALHKNWRSGGKF